MAIGDGSRRPPGAMAQQPRRAGGLRGHGAPMLMLMGLGGGEMGKDGIEEKGGDGNDGRDSPNSNGAS